MMSRLEDVLGFQQQALRLRSERQQLLASNIANADTPGYQAKDMDFAAALKAALSQQASASQPAQTQSGHLSAQGLSGAGYITQRPPLQNSLDGNTVDMDTERNQFTENALRYEVSLSLAHEDIKNLLAAIQG